VWLPRKVFFEAGALDYRRGRDMLALFQGMGVPVEVMTAGGRVKGLTAATPLKALQEAKRTLVVRVHKAREFAACRPSAHYQLPLAGSCPGRCEYCYLYTRLGKRPYLRAYVNVEEILERAGAYMQERLPERTIFEGSATSDPLPLEPFTGALKTAIEYFGRQPHGRFRFVTKFTRVEGLLNVDHGGHTRFRFSVNSDRVIKDLEHGTSSLGERLQALGRVAAAGYPVGLLVAPVFLEGDWRAEYGALLERLSREAASLPDLTLEVILHRFTSRAKNTILDFYPATRLPLEEEGRRFKYGQFGYGKYVYPAGLYREAEEFFLKKVETLLPAARVEYLV
jgi:spore photoproduct lyase